MEIFDDDNEHSPLQTTAAFSLLTADPYDKFHQQFDGDDQSISPSTTSTHITAVATASTNTSSNTNSISSRSGNGHLNCSSRHGGIVLTTDYSYRVPSMEQISSALNAMDRKFSAVFSTWIMDESNLEAAVSNYARIANQYPLPLIIQSMRYLTSRWRLKSIILIVVQTTKEWQSIDRLATVVRELGGRWKAPYIAELALAVMRRWDAESNSNQQDRQKELFLQALMDSWQFTQISNILLAMGDKIEWSLKSSIFKWYHGEALVSRKALAVVSQLQRNAAVTAAKTISCANRSKTPTPNDRLSLGRSVLPCRSATPPPGRSSNFPCSLPASPIRANIASDSSGSSVIPNRASVDYMEGGIEATTVTARPSNSSAMTAAANRLSITTRLTVATRSVSIENHSPCEAACSPINHRRLVADNREEDLHSPSHQTIKTCSPALLEERRKSISDWNGGGHDQRNLADDSSSVGNWERTSVLIDESVESPANSLSNISFAAYFSSTTTPTISANTGNSNLMDG